MAGFALLAIIGGVLWSNVFLHVRDVEAVVAYPLYEVAAEPLIVASDERSESVRGTLRRGESIFNLLSRHGMGKPRIHELVRASKQVTDLARVRTGTPYRILRGPTGDVTAFEMDVTSSRVLRVSETPFGFVAAARPIAYDTRPRVLSGRAGTSLFTTLLQEPGGADLIRRLRDLFAWRVDFHRDIRPGDQYLTMVDEVWREGEFDHFGTIHYAQVMVASNNVEAVRFADEYYDPEGRPLRETLLPAPLDYRYISSRFTHTRRHPVTGRVEPHYGIDYVASYGTPVRAAGDGVVTWVGKRGYNGRLVTIRHNGVYRSGYAHLSRYGKGMKRGREVRQGDIIGYVGNSGRSTGTHLHYALYRDGRPVDPLRIDSAPVAASIDITSDLAFVRAVDEARLASTRLENVTQQLASAR